MLIWTEWSFYTFQNGHHEISTTTKNTTHHRNNSKLKLMRWRNEIRAFTSKLTKLIAHIIFPSCMTRASSQLIYAAFLLFVKVLRRSWKTPPPTTLIFFVCMYLSEFFFFFFRDGSSCCLLVVVKGDVDCKAMFNVVSVCHTNTWNSLHLCSKPIQVKEKNNCWLYYELKNVSTMRIFNPFLISSEYFLIDI